jgi:hypothetical protein
MEAFLEFEEETPNQTLHRLYERIRKLGIEKDALHGLLESDRKHLLNRIYNQSQEIEFLSQQNSLLERSKEHLEGIFRKLRIDLPNTEEPNHDLD